MVTAASAVGGDVNLTFRWSTFGRTSKNLSRDSALFARDSFDHGRSYYI
jgi:hypothetical protein